MNLILLRPRLSLPALLFVSILTAATSAFMQGQQADSCVNQSPRQVVFDRNRTSPPAQGLDYNFFSTSPLVQRTSEEQIKYQGHTLYRCDKHFHIPVENIQGCAQERVDKRTPDNPLPIDQWLEIHTVYAAVVSRTGQCESGLDHDLACCIVPPFVVLGYSAKIAGADSHPLHDLVEWSGSRTGKDDPTGCRELPAQWNFQLGCDATVTRLSLQPIGKAHFAREKQSPNRVSVDLTLLPLHATEPNNTCRFVQTGAIANDAEADKVCPGVCRNPLNKAFKAANGHVVWHPSDGGAVCQCCALDRPQ
ncbi:MAG TPA: hypothetical protein VGJ30_17205 [Candidatus Angelobacter sp.]